MYCMGQNLYLSTRGKPIYDQAFITLIIVQSKFMCKCLKRCLTTVMLLKVNIAHSYFSKYIAFIDIHV